MSRSVLRGYLWLAFALILAACSGGGDTAEPTISPSDSAVLLQKAVAETNLSGTADSEKQFTLELPAGKVDLTIDTSGGSGDVDLFVRHGEAPTTTLYDCQSATLDDATETCYFNTPEPGTYHILLYGDSAYSDIEIIADYEDPPERPTGNLPGGAAYGDVPSGLPARMAIGLMESKGTTWMRDSGVDWDIRYAYFTKAWRNNWGHDSTNSGIWGLEWLQECDDHGFIPAVQYYSLNDHPGGGEKQFLNKAADITTMASYFDDFKLFMQYAKTFGKPVLVMLEADGFAFLERQAEEDPNTYAAVADTGIPELSDLPNTVAGWGLAFLKLRKEVGADNVILGIHISAWASGPDIAYASTNIPLQPEVDKVYAFLSELGLAANITGETYDVLVGDPLDRDSDFYRLERNDPDRWWDMDDNAPIASKSFNRHAEWMRLWNKTSGKRWVLWQIPLGNSHHLNEENTGQPRGGYKDNRTEYFFANGTAHLEKYADVGAIALLFGAGMVGQSFYTNDYDDKGDLYLKTHADAILGSGGVPIAATGQ